MANVDVKRIRERATKINDAWRQGAPAAKFMNISQADFQADLEAAAAADQEVADAQAQLDMKRSARDSKYAALNEQTVRVREGVEGNADHGTDSHLYGAMGFTRASERASGLTRKQKTPPTSGSKQ
jgi:hypothetical protein